ncbi:hypothetical protein ABBQ32_005925 [Trebouxia sp. C0010 RCD-2024]
MLMLASLFTESQSTEASQALGTHTGPVLHAFSSAIRTLYDNAHLSDIVLKLETQRYAPITSFWLHSHPLSRPCSRYTICLFGCLQARQLALMIVAVCTAFQMYLVNMSDSMLCDIGTSSCTVTHVTDVFQVFSCLIKR